MVLILETKFSVAFFHFWILSPRNVLGPVFWILHPGFVNVLNQIIGAPSLIKPRESERDLGSIDPDEVQNPVGLLQELMQKNGLAIPEYTAGSETAPPFTHTVKLPASGQSCTGQGMG